MSEQLTARQLDVARLVAEGHSDKVIALRLRVTENTVSYHIGAIVHRLKLDRQLNTRVLITRYVLAAYTKS